MSEFLSSVEIGLAAAGGTGAVARHLATRSIPLNPRWLTLMVNLLGSLLIGLVSGPALASSATGVAAGMVAFCGGFTTFSGLALQGERLRGEVGIFRALAWVVTQLICCSLAVLVAWHLSAHLS